MEAPADRVVVDEDVDPFGAMKLGLTGRVDSKSGDLGRIPKTATAMLSKDAERVGFYQLFHMSGAVEGWLAELVLCMQHSLKVLLEGAISDALSWDVEKPREEWLFGVPAQLALLASQVRLLHVNNEGGKGGRQNRGAERSAMWIHFLTKQNTSVI
jgi:hypothetical protein